MTLRCAIVPVGGATELAEVIGQALARATGFGCVRGSAADLPALSAPGLDAVLFAASADAAGMLPPSIGELRQRRPECAILVSGEGYAEPQIASVFAAGAHDFVEAPIRSHELCARLRHALGLIALNVPPPLEGRPDSPARAFIGTSPSFVRQVARLPAIAGCDAGVLITGETGTGKEICAQAIHYLSPRASSPWVAVNCGAIPVELIESELFGHVRGAYTTALSAREGLVAEAEGGTLFLDDIDCLPLSAQSKLLRFLQEREYRMVGANAVRRANVRVIAASNRDLLALATRGHFRQDLYFRLNVLSIELPPLRSRREDIPALALHFLREYARERRLPAPALSPQAIRRLLTHDWPGNVRELQHVIERSLLLARGPVLGPPDLEIPGARDEAQAAPSFRHAKDEVVRQFERVYIEQLLFTFEGNVTHAAREAKKNRRAFFALIRKHGIEPGRFRPAR